ncbi:hypothetical protein C8Q73DRAFT_791223 [Cubamyces lactineus]|nr:hypothetical protein C8Q73DRAFT_791223 [Cubamyces lactineus]
MASPASSPSPSPQHARLGSLHAHASWIVCDGPVVPDASLALLPCSTTRIFNPSTTEDVNTEDGQTSVPLGCPSLSPKDAPPSETAPSPAPAGDGDISSAPMVPYIDFAHRRPRGAAQEKAVLPRPTRSAALAVAPIAALRPNQSSAPSDMQSGSAFDQQAARAPPSDDPPSTLQSTDWEQYRNAKDIRGGKGETVWYKTSGRYEMCHPPSSLRAEVDAIFIHHDQRTARSKLWVLNTSHVWVSVRAGDKQPSDPSRRLNIQRNGDPSWVTKETWSVYRSRRRQVAAPWASLRPVS